MTSRHPPHWPFPQLIAHRGGGTLAPENTLIGLQTAVQFGFGGVEFDAKLTRDGVAILMHDDTLDRTTTGNGAVAQTDWRVIQTLDAGIRCGQHFAGERVPTLASALALCMKLRLWPNVEIKACVGRERETALAVAQDVVKVWKDPTPPLLSSFSVPALQAAREAAPLLPLGLLVNQVPDDWREQMRAMGCFSLHCEHSAATQSLLNDATAAGCPILCYTVNRAKTARRLLSLGVSGIVTDRLDLISPD